MTVTRHVRANAVAYLALFVALGGTSYAAISLPANSVGTAQIKRGAITSAKVKNASLLASDFTAGTLRGPAGRQGAAGDRGAAGADGPQGAAGAAGAPGTIGLDGAAGKAYPYQRTKQLDPGDDIRAVVDGLTDGSADDPWLVKLEPGAYGLGGTVLEIPAYVDLEGAGAAATRLVSTAGSAAAVVLAGGANELRALSLDVTPVAGPAIGISGGASAMTLRGVRVGVEADGAGATAVAGDRLAILDSELEAVATGPSSFAIALNDGSDGPARVSGSRLVAEVGTGASGADAILSTSADHRIVSSTIEAIAADAGTLARAVVLLGAGARMVITGSAVIASTTGSAGRIAAWEDGGSTLLIGGSRLSGGVFGSPTCMSSWKNDFSASLNSSCG